MSKRGYDRGTAGWWMDDRRGELGMTWDEVAEHAGISVGNLYRIAGDPEAARRMRATTKKGLERALQWKRGSIDSIASGGEPTALPDERASEILPDPPHEWSAEERAKILAMTFEDIIDFGRMLRRTSGDHAALLWLKEATRLKTEQGSLDSERT
ncbi:hypothetical protein [Amycolatopsis sp. NPDC001319]|uniref:hypothetical protein n=1 Tax=unclassified Amycolatopsis TaxID=2618356 RepID=UPI003698EDF7